MLEAIRQDPGQAELVIEHTEYLRCEIEEAAESEMVVKLDDFLRRRAKVALVVRHDDLIHARGLMEACRILFGDKAQQKYDEYLAEHGQSPAARLRLV